ncbi:MAG TPA: DinB family protein [Gemmatimonadales bacterium]|jgi:uncharacterized damage-inducible protein DinB|nr:DinB family protein [Gemmatimonadales bacterium]
MNKTMLDQMWDQFRQKYGVYLRLLDAIPADKYASHPVAGMRTPAELAVHISGSIVRDIAQGVAKGRITANEASEGAVAAELGGKAAVLTFAGRCFEQANEAVARIGDAELSAMVPTPWGMSWPGWVAFQVLSEEFLHHRGQLSAYARACGVEPPFIWGYEQNADAYRPKAEPAGAGA